MMAWMSRRTLGQWGAMWFNASRPCQPKLNYNWHPWFFRWLFWDSPSVTGWHILIAWQLKTVYTNITPNFLCSRSMIVHTAWPNCRWQWLTQSLTKILKGFTISIVSHMSSPSDNLHNNFQWTPKDAQNIFGFLCIVAKIRKYILSERCYVLWLKLF